MRLFGKKQKVEGRRPLNQSGKPNAAFSYYASDVPKGGDTVRARQASEQRAAFFSRLRLVPTLIISGVIFLSVVYSTTLSTNPSIVFSGGDSPYRALSDYKRDSEVVFKSSIFNRSKLTLNAPKTSQALLKTFPELDIATVSLPVIGRRPTITLHVRQPALVLTTGSGAYVVDVAGKVVATAAVLLSSTRQELLTVQDHSGLKVAVGNQVLTADSVRFIATVVAQLKAKQLVVTQAILPPVPNEVDFYVKDQAYFVKTDTTGDGRVQAGDYLAAKDSGVAPKEYMDVRVEEKVFYK